VSAPPVTVTASTWPTRLVLVPGLGADRRLFDHLELPGFEVLRTSWITHDPREDLATYAARFARHYGLTSADTLIGVSMGGIVAGIIAQTIPPRQLIRISSCSHINQLSPFISMFSALSAIAPLGLARYLPGPLIPQSRRLLLAMFKQTDMGFIRWACRAISRWPGAPRTQSAVTIHGTADRVFPFKLQPQVDVAIAVVSHLMVFERGPEVEAALLAQLSRANGSAGLPPRQSSASS
jgi:pimeloyl-ACP methyl ester carboxylesterase